MRTLADIIELLVELEHRIADELEAQDLDFKEWNGRSLDDATRLVVDMAICMANGGGGTVVFGVADKTIGRTNAILGVPPTVDVNLLRKRVYDQTDPKLTPHFEELVVPEGTGRLLVMQVLPGLPPFTDTSGRGRIRIGKDCQPLTGSLRKGISVDTGETDYSAETLPGEISSHLSASAMEQLRNQARQEKAPEDLLRQGDVDFLGGLRLIRDCQLTRAGLLLAGREESLRRHAGTPGWTFLRMASDTDYTERRDGLEAFPLALARLEDQIMADNPIHTEQRGLFHFEYRTYPELALREGLLNAFCHRDYRLGSPILVKQFPGRLEITSPGGFIGGVRPDNILHHPPAPRNPLLVEVLIALRLVNRSNLGVPRMFKAFLLEGKEPPSLSEAGDAVRLVFFKTEFSGPLRHFVAQEEQMGRPLSADHLLLIHHLLRHAEITGPEASVLIQRSDQEARETLTEMERHLGYLDRGGTGRGSYWSLRQALHARLALPGHPERDRRLDWEAAKTRILSLLKQRAERGEPGLSNQELRQITRLGRKDIVALMTELRAENSHLLHPGLGRFARYVYTLNVPPE
jgi:ATP-dependent DNA helicase RecG